MQSFFVIAKEAGAKAELAQAQAAKEKEANANEFTKRAALNCGTETTPLLKHTSTSPVQFAAPDSATFVASERTHPPLLKYPPQRPGCGSQHNIQRLLGLMFGNVLDTASSSSSSYDQRLYVCLGIEIKVPHPFPQNFLGEYVIQLTFHGRGPTATGIYVH